MRHVHVVTAALAVAGLASTAACNESKSGANDRILFTPTDCGNLGGCDFDDSIGVHGTIGVQISGIDGQPTAGLDLASRDSSVVSVVRRADIDGAPAWDLTAESAGVAQLAALDVDGTEIDFVEVPVQDVAALTMVPFVGSPVGPNPEDGYDEAFTINNNAASSWSVRPLIAGGAQTMGRFAFDTVTDAGAPSLLDYEAANSDRPNGYFYVEPPTGGVIPTGDYPIRFELVADGAIGVDAIVHVP